MSHIAEDVYRRTSIRIREVIPDFIESEYPQFVAFIEAYYRFLEQADNNPINAPFIQQTGVITVQANNSIITGGNTEFVGANTAAPIFAPYTKLRVGSDILTVQSTTNNTSLVVFEIPSRTYFANTFSAQLNPSQRQASGALRQLLTYRDLQHTIDEFLIYYRDTYLRDLPYGAVDTPTMIERVLDFYQARGGEESFRFLFRTIFDKPVSISYPRDQVFMASDGHYEAPTIVKIDRSSINGDPYLLETRQILGLTSGATATILRITISFEGEAEIVTAFLDAVQPRSIEGNLLLNSELVGDDTSRLIARSEGIPPQGSSLLLYDWFLSLEDSVGTTFIPGETITTLPSNDPIAITGQLVGSVIAFNVVARGAGYQIGDLIYPPINALLGFGSGAIGRVSSFSNTDIDDINIDVPGERYYTGLSIIVDNSGTGGTGLAGTVTKISSGRLLLHPDTGMPPDAGPPYLVPIEEGDALLFVVEETDIATGSPIYVDYTATRETIDYFEEGIKLTDVLQEGAEPFVVIGSSDWSNSNTFSGLFGVNLTNPIVDVLSQLSTIPVYVNGQRIGLGGVSEVTVTSLGTGYFTAPTLSVEAPVRPTRDIAGTQNVADSEMPFVQAQVSAAQISGQVGTIDVISGGSGYTNTETFLVNSVMTSSMTGSGLTVNLALGAVSTGQGRFLDTRGQVSADRYIQDITYYQPFSYVLTVEEDVSRYRQAVERFVHPSGGLLIPRQTITSVASLRANVNIDIDIVT